MIVISLNKYNSITSADNVDVIVACDLHGFMHFIIIYILHMKF